MSLTNKGAARVGIFVTSGRSSATCCPEVPEAESRRLRRHPKDPSGKQFLRPPSGPPFMDTVSPSAHLEDDSNMVSGRWTEWRRTVEGPKKGHCSFQAAIWSNIVATFLRRIFN